MAKLLNRVVWAVVRWCIQYEGSTRGAALIRIGTAPILWSRCGPELRLLDFTAAPFVFFASVLFFVGTLLMFVGYKTRVACILAGIAVTYFHNGEALYNQAGKQFLYTQYWWLPVCLAMTDSGKSFSLDRWLALRKAKKTGKEPPAEWGSLFGLRLLAIHMSHIYFWGAYDKTDWEWFNGERLDRIWMDQVGTSEYPEGPLFAFGFRASAWATVLLEYALAFALYFRRGRWIVMPMGIAMHVFFYATLWVHAFTAQMILCYLAFIPAATTHSVVDRILGRGPASTDADREGGQA